MQDVMKKEIEKLCAESYDKGVNDTIDVVMEQIDSLVVDEPIYLGQALIEILKTNYKKREN